MIVERVGSADDALEVFNDVLLDDAALGLDGEHEDLVVDDEDILELGAGELLDEMADEVAALV